MPGSLAANAALLVVRSASTNMSQVEHTSGVRWHTTHCSWEELKLAADRWAIFQSNHLSSEKVDLYRRKTSRFFQLPQMTCAPISNIQNVETPMIDFPVIHSPMVVESPTATKAVGLYSDVLRIKPSSHPVPSVKPRNRSQPTTATTIPTQEIETIFDVVMARAQTQQQSLTGSAASTALVMATLPTLQPFRPNEMVLAQQGLLTSSVHNFAHADTKYQGDLKSRSYISQHANLPDKENCALFVTNIPPQVKHSEIFDLIHVGPVFALHINPADAQHSMQAAKLIFMGPESAQQLLKATVQVHGRVLGFRYNRHGYRRNDRDYSRVLVVEGPEKIMKSDFWDKYFKTYSDLVYDRVIEVDCPNAGNKAFAFHFARIDGQAETCLLAIRAEPSFQGIVTVRYAQDPCGA
ncbi:hypothetical protein LARI1_G008778 [Lachnellula arida]|uniref:RRM domain-containing protein n=1 Tax=Lachnellula arida TaxID=1316785 RepID=A0A8T9BAF2_9HELO|nr:hypothetical protein LARI1_G008778 [Lachnellula arida]